MLHWKSDQKVRQLMWTAALSVRMRGDKFTQTTEILWRKRDDTAALSVKERAGPIPCLDRLLFGLIRIGIQGVYTKLSVIVRQ